MSLGPSQPAILVLAKAPRPGHSKTRLIPAFGPLPLCFDLAFPIAPSDDVDKVQVLLQAEKSF